MRFKIKLKRPLSSMPQRRGMTRRFRLRRFKRYAVLIAKIDGTPTVIAFEHSSPEYWRDRLL